MMEPQDPHCQQLASPGYINFILSILILVGILISYLPQHTRILSLRSSFGISPFYVLLGTTSCTASLANILVLPRSTQDASCCREISGIACFASLLGIFQVGLQWLCFSIILALFVIYFPRVGSFASPATSDPQPSFRTAIIVMVTCILHGLVLLITSVFVFFMYPSHLQAWANFLGVMAAVLASIQYLPQIYTTFRLRRVGSLSIPMMCIQTPGAIVWASSLAARLGLEGWSTWGVYVVTALFQGILLDMAIYFEYISPKEETVDVSPPLNSPPFYSPSGDEGANVLGHEQPSEETPLLQSS